MSDQSDQSSGQNPSGRPSFGEAVRAKMEEYDVDRHLHELADTVEHVVRQGVARAGALAHEHQGDIERLIDKAAGVVDRRTDGRHAATIQQVRGSIERGVGRIADQRPDAGSGQSPTGDVPPDSPGSPSSPYDG
jgi:hypothetical protein